MRNAFSISVLSALALIPFWACSSGYEKIPDGVIVCVNEKNENGASKVRLKVIDDKLIRVSASATGKFSSDTSLVVIENKEKTDFEIKATDSLVTLTTAALKATVNRNNGAVTFYDKTGMPILQEEEGGRKFEPINVEGTDGFTVTQSFKSLDDEEGLYGLGQHQSNEFNYKHKNEELFQYNTKVSVPFIVSSNNYGSVG